MINFRTLALAQIRPTLPSVRRTSLDRLLQPHASRRGHGEGKALLATDLTDATEGKGSPPARPLGNARSFPSHCRQMPMPGGRGKALLLAMEGEKGRGTLI
jgi:hypothetical protein